MSKAARLITTGLLAFGMASVFAQSSGWSYHTDPATGRVTVYTNSGVVGGWDQTVGNNSNTFKYSSGGSTAPGASYQSVKQLGNGLVLEAPAQAKVPKTNSSVPVIVKRSIPYSAVAKGLFRALPVVSSVYAIGNLLEEIGCELGSDAVNPVLCNKEEQGMFTGYFVYEGIYTTTLVSSGSTPAAACQAVAEVKPPPNEMFRGWATPQSAIVGTDKNGFCERYFYGYDWRQYRITQGTIRYETKNTTSTKLLPASEAEVSAKLYERPSLNYVAPAFEEIVSTPSGVVGISEGIASAPDDTTLSLPGGSQSMQVGQPVVTTTNTTNSAGDSITKTETTTTYATTNNNVVNYYTQTVVNTTNNTTNTTTTETSTTNQQSKATDAEIITCGLPGTPPCKIDESGTPTAGADPEITAFDQVKTCLQNPVSCLPAFPELSWAFTVPSSCTAIPVSGFGEYISEIDICPFQSMFHDLMSMIWLAAGLFGASAMLFRDSQGA